MGNLNKVGGVKFVWNNHETPDDMDPTVPLETKRLKRGVHEIKCYITNAHILNEIRSDLPNPNFHFEFSTVKAAKQMVHKSYKILQIIHDQNNLKDYMHRCEIVWRPTPVLKHVTLTQLICLAYYIKKYVLHRYGVYPLQDNQYLPISKNIQRRTVRVIWELMHFLQKRNSTLLKSPIIPYNKKVWFDAMVALVMTGLGITGSKLRTIYTSWESFPERDNVYDPHLFFEW